MKFKYHFGEEKPYEVLEDINIRLSDGTIILISKGFTSDGSSSPYSFWGLFPPFGDFILAAIVHDYLYNVDKSRGRMFADKEMLTISDKYNNKNLFKTTGNYARYFGVRCIGWYHFNK